jgi:hypothetical protein
MKNIILLIAMVSSLCAFADIDESALKQTEPKPGEVESARSCFREYETLGCGHPREDLEHFKSCMENVSSSITPKCQNIMNGLYKKR